MPAVGQHPAWPQQQPVPPLQPWMAHPAWWLQQAWQQYWAPRQQYGLQQQYSWPAQHAALAAYSGGWQGHVQPAGACPGPAPPPAASTRQLGSGDLAEVAADPLGDAFAGSFAALVGDLSDLGLAPAQGPRYSPVPAASAVGPSAAPAAGGGGSAAAVAGSTAGAVGMWGTNAIGAGEARVLCCRRHAVAQALRPRALDPWDLDPEAQQTDGFAAWSGCLSDERRSLLARPRRCPLSECSGCEEGRPACPHCGQRVAIWYRYWGRPAFMCPAPQHEACLLYSSYVPACIAEEWERLRRRRMERQCERQLRQQEGPQPPILPAQPYIF